MNEILKGIIHRFAGKHVAVVGDLMLDMYVWGRASRISPEAPVPVLEVGKVTSCPGGAANVMRNVATLGGRCSAFGVIGDDEHAQILRDELAEYSVDTCGIVVEAGRGTTCKQRVVAGTQQLLRIDYEKIVPPTAEILAQVEKALGDLIVGGAVDAVIFEDYAKGLLNSAMVSRLNKLALRNGIITLLDPKPGNLLPVRDLCVMKPNRQEAMMLAGVIPVAGADDAARWKELDRAAETLLADWNMKYLLISLAADGMALYDRDSGRRELIPTRAKEVFDVSGAGDTVMAAFSLAMSAGATPKEAAELANFAAGIVVGKLGTVTVSAEELAMA
ncbi:MAG: PfkB family carbohydrate kinase [Victivallaceae bacterium]|nr:PfkB family carbohydrate kinase [Victivallaceae bacterium]